MPPSTITVTRHGEEHEPVVVFDGFAAEPDELIADAALLSFVAGGGCAARPAPPGGLRVTRPPLGYAICAIGTAE